MNKIQKIKTAPESFYIAIFVLLIFAVFLAINPKASSTLKPVSEHRWNVFYQDVSRKKISVQSLWEFREFYSPGYIHTISDGPDNKNFASILKDIKITPNSNSKPLQILYFESKKILSIDFLVNAEKLDEVIKIPNKKIKFSNNELVYREGNRIKIAFLKSIDELKKVNGYLDFEGRDKNLNQNKMWLELTSISLD